MAAVHKFEDFNVTFPGSPVGMSVKSGVLIELNGGETEELARIVTDELPKFLELFISKNQEYGENAQTLGARGQFADIWRKIAKLKTGLWDGNEDRLKSEGVDEILRDLIGHCLLTLRIRQAERDAESAALEQQLWHGREEMMRRIEENPATPRRTRKRFAEAYDEANQSDDEDDLLDE